MKARKFVVSALVLILVAGLFVSFSQAAQRKGKAPAKPQEPIFIPAPVKTVMEAGIATRQGRQDIPITIIRNYFFPAAQGSLHAAFLFKVKNADLGFVPAAPVVSVGSIANAPIVCPADLAGPFAREQATAQQEVTVPAKLQAKIDLFIQFRQMENGAPSKVFKEVYHPVVFEEDSATYDPEKEEWYSVGYPLPPGDYLMSLALTSPDLTKIGVAYHELSLYNEMTIKEPLDTTPIFLVKKMDQMEAVETTMEIHKGFFTYSILQIVPVLDNAVAVGESIEIFYFVFGAKANDQQKNDIEATYEIKQGDTSILKWEGQKYEIAVVSQPLPMSKSMLIKDDKGERQETTDLPAGKYELVITIKDNIGGSTIARTMDLEIR